MMNEAVLRPALAFGPKSFPGGSLFLGQDPAFLWASATFQPLGR